MAVKRIEATNFRSINELAIDLHHFNVLVGANASGKSNILQLFKFLKDISTFGLENAISLQGGVKFLRNTNIGSSKELRISVTFDSSLVFPISSTRALNVQEATYSFTLKFNKRGLGYSISSDVLEQRCSILNFDKPSRSPRRRSQAITSLTTEPAPIIGSIFIRNQGGKISVSSDLPSEIGFDEGYILPRFARQQRLPKKSLVLEERIMYFMPPQLFDFAMYDFDPRMAKKAIPITGRAELEEDGNNLALILQEVLRSKQNKRRFANLISDLLPFITNVDVENTTDKSVLVRFSETYIEDNFLPATFVSDGTIDVAALIVALYFQSADVVIIEEPERNIHPSLISRQMEMLKDASATKQIIISTHNPIMLRNADVNDILLVYRDGSHFTSIIRPQDVEAVRRFLEEDYPIEDLFVDNMLLPLDL